MRRVSPAVWPGDARLFVIELVAVHPGRFKRLSSHLIRLERIGVESGLWFPEDAYLSTPLPNLHPRRLGRVFTHPLIGIELRCPAVSIKVDFGVWPVTPTRPNGQLLHNLTSSATSMARRAMLTDTLLLHDEPNGTEQCLVVLVKDRYGDITGILLAVIACRLKAAIVYQIPDPLPEGSPIGDLKTHKWQDLSLSVLRHPLRLHGLLFVHALVPEVASSAEFEVVAPVVVHVAVK